MEDYVVWLPKIVGKTISRSYYDRQTDEYVVEFSDGARWKQRSAPDGTVVETEAGARA